MDRYILLYAAIKSLLDISQKFNDDYLTSNGDSMARKAMLKALIESSDKSKLEILVELQSLSLQLLGIDCVDSQLLAMHKELKRRGLKDE